MVDLYLKLQIFFKYILPIAIFVIIFFIIIFASVCAVIRESRIEKHFKENVYERHLIGVPSFGNGSFYGWKKDNKIIDDRDIKNLSVKDIKKKYK